MPPSSRNFNLFQTAKNILANTTFFLFEILISLWYTPFLLRRLGSELFSFIPLANSVTNYFSIIMYSLNISIGRYITIELEKGDVRRANQIFNTNLVITLLLISAVIPVGVVLVILAPTIFTIPSGWEYDVRILFVGVIAAFLLGTYRINYSLATFAKNRFDLRNLVGLGGRIVQVLIIVILFNFRQPNLLYVGVGAACAALFNLAGDYYLWRMLLPELKVRWREFSRKKLKLLFGTGMWTFLYQAGFILFLNVDMLVANRALDLKLAGMYGALLVIPKNLRIMSVAVGGVWGPSILAKYSQSDFQGMDKIVRTSIKVTGLTLALIVGLLCGLADPFLSIWLGADFQPMIWVLILMIFPLSTNLIVSPFFNIHVSFNKLKMPALIALALGASNLLLAIFLTPKYGTMGLVAAGVFTLTLFYSFFSPIYAARVMGLSWTHYFKQLGMVTLATLGVAVISYSFAKAMLLSSYLHLIIVGGLISLGYLILVYFLGLSSKEKKMIKSFLAKVTGNN